MMKSRRTLPLPLFFAVLLATLVSTPLFAACTATQNCNNACSILSFECPAPYCCVFSCSAQSQVVSCTGASTCTVGTNSVTCDGHQTTCQSTPQCSSSTYSITCGKTTRTCTHSCAC
jgi:hypothetical protein